MAYFPPQLSVPSSSHLLGTSANIRELREVCRRYTGEGSEEGGEGIWSADCSERDNPLYTTSDQGDTLRSVAFSNIDTLEI